MSIIERIKNASLLVKAILALMVLLPSITVFLELVDVPPTVGGMIYIISSCVSVFVILAIILMSDRLERISNGRFVIYAALALLVGGFCLTRYIPFAITHLVPFEREDGSAAKALAPMSPSREILGLVRHKTPGRPTVSEYSDALQMSDEQAELERMMASRSWLTMVIMLFLLVCSEVLLIAPVVAVAWKLAGGVVAPDGDKDIPAGPDVGNAGREAVTAPPSAGNGA